MAATGPTPPQPSEKRRWYQFGLAAMLLVTALVSVLAAAWAGLVREDARYQYFAMAVASPLAVLVVISLLRSAVRWLSRTGFPRQDRR